MQTVASMADRLGQTAEWAIKQLKSVDIEVEGPESTIDDDTCDLLIEIDDDPSVAERVREQKIKEREKEEKKKLRAKAAAKKGAATRKAAAKKKAPAKKAKAGEAAESEEAAGVEQDDEAAHPVVEIIRGDTTIAPVVPEPEPVPKAAPAVEVKPRPAKKPPKKQVEKPKPVGIVIGAAVDRVEPVVEIVRADGTHLHVEDAELVDAGAVEAGVDEEEESSILAEAERRQEEEEERKARSAAKPLVKPDPAVVAEVQRKAAERMARLQVQRAVEARRSTGTGKTARKREKRLEKMRADEGMRRDATAAVRAYTASGVIPFGTRKKKRKYGRGDDTDVQVLDEPEEALEPIEVEESMSVEELASRMDVPVNDIILALMDLEIMATKNQALSIDIVRQLAEPRGFEVRSVIPEEDDVLAESPDSPESLQPRAPVITVMGHVDHGKTTFLDRVRKSNVAEGEAGGITQHIAAYDVQIGDGRVVFLDTPGHEAFTQMRARGAQVTDIVVLVVAADDGVMPQTVEAIDHAKAADVPIVVAVNKIDKPDAQPERIRQELMKYELLDEQWGGKTIMRDISAKSGDGIPELMELLVLQSELLELKSNPDKAARGAIIESEISRGQGPVAWVLVRSGTLRQGDVFLAGETYGRVRMMHNARGEAIQVAGPSTPVVVTGFSAPANAGDHFVVLQDERTARAIAEKRVQYAKQKQGQAARRITLEDFHLHLTAGQKNELNVVLKADVQGSVDVLESSFTKVGNEEVGIKIVHAGVGQINESDIILASASNAVIIGFHVSASPRAQKLAEQEGVDIRTYRIIYEAIEDVRLALQGMLKPDSKEVVTGHAEVRAVFKSSAIGNIAGCYVQDGEVTRTSFARVMRDREMIYEGKVGTLKRLKDDVRQVQSGFECGIKLEGFEEIAVGDIIELYRIESVAKTLN